jgi:hypothetical protein
MDELIHYISENQKKYYDEYKEFLADIENDEEERDYERWHSKHFNSNWFLNLWKSISKYDVEIIQQVIEDKQMDYIIRQVNWVLMSRLVDLTDKKFMAVFGRLLSMDFAKKYNDTYNQYITSK